VCAHGIDDLHQLAVLEHFVRNGPPASVRFIGCDDFHMLKSAGVERAAKPFDPGNVGSDLVPDSGVVHLQAVNVLGGLNEFHDVIRHVL